MSFLSIVNRISGALLSTGAIMLVAGLIAAAKGASRIRLSSEDIRSSPGQIILFGLTLAFLLYQLNI